MAQWTDEQKKEIVRKTIEAFNRRDLALYLSYHTPDATSWEVYFEKPLDIQASSEYIPNYWRAFPDAKVDPQVMYVSGDTVIVENIVSGTFTNEFLGQKPTGKRFEQGEGVFFELKDGKIKAVRIYMDRKTQEEQLGIG
ncbi:MAG: ester cyclase [Anaerolineaceae bacterium]|nr:ester cyclase [Anaerolineaceae bacterium]